MWRRTWAAALRWHANCRIGEGKWFENVKVCPAVVTKKKQENNDSHSLVECDGAGRCVVTNLANVD